MLSPNTSVGGTVEHGELADDDQGENRAGGEEQAIEGGVRPGQVSRADARIRRKRSSCQSSCTLTIRKKNPIATRRMGAAP